MIEKVTAIEKKGGMLHGPQNALVIQTLVELPICEENHRMSTFRGAVGVDLKAEAFLNLGQVLPGIVQGFGVSNPPGRVLLATLGQSQERGIPEYRQCQP